MIDDILKDAKQRMSKSVESLENELSKIRTGRAHPSLLEHVKVDRACKSRLLRCGNPFEPSS